MNGYAKNGIHLFRTRLPPDDWLKRLNPQSVVLVGSYEHEDAVVATQLAAAHLVNLLPNAVVKVRYWHDDNILRVISPAGFAKLFFPLHVPGTHLGVGNEDEQNSDDVRVFAETVRLWCEVVTLANAAGIPLAIGSTPMGTPQYGQYELMIPLWKLFAEGRKLGLYHIYTPNSYFPWNGNQADIDHLARRHETEMYRVCAVAGIEPPPMMHGEYNTVESVEKSDMGPAATGLPVRLWVAGILRAGLKHAANIYVYGNGLYDRKWWSFNVEDCPGYMEAMVNDLPRSPYTLLEEWENARVPTTVNMVTQACPDTSPLRKLNSGEIVQTYLRDGKRYQGKNGQWEEFCVKQFNGVDWLCRLMDISMYLSPQHTVYALFEDEALTRPGGKWCPVNLSVGEVVERRVWVQIFDAYTGAKISAGSGWDTTYFKCAALHPTWTTFEGIQVQNVAECIYGHNRADIVIGTGVKERYFYSGGLVGFIDYNFNPPKQTVVTREQPTALPAQIKIPWWNPVITPAPVPPPQVNVPANPGNPTPVRVKATALNMRYDHSTSAKVIRQLAVNEEVSIFMDTVTPLINNYVWVFVATSRDKGWAALRGAWGESFAPADAPQFKLLLPVGCDVITTSKFGVPRDYDGDGIFDDKHEGIDFAPAHKNCTPLILAGADGTVTDVSSTGDYGLHLKIKHVVGADTYVTWYCHMEKMLVKAGDTVKAGDFIGVMGSTGNSTGPHLHLNVQHIGHGLSGYVISDAVDPAAYLVNVPQSLSLVA